MNVNHEVSREQSVALACVTIYGIAFGTLVCMVGAFVSAEILLFGVCHIAVGVIALVIAVLGNRMPRLSCVCRIIVWSGLAVVLSLAAFNAARANEFAATVFLIAIAIPMPALAVDAFLHVPRSRSE